MKTSIEIPGGAHEITSVVLANDTLTVRLVMPYFDEGEFYAYEVVVLEPHDADTVSKKLSLFRIEHTSLYCEFRDDMVVFITDDGVETEIHGSDFRANATSPTQSEYSAEFKRVREMYESEWKTTAMAHEKLNALRSLIGEQMRRLEIKSQAHLGNRSITILYEQHKQFLSRILNEINS